MRDDAIVEQRSNWLTSWWSGPRRNLQRWMSLSMLTPNYRCDLFMCLVNIQKYQKRAMRHTYLSDQSNDWILYVRGYCGRRISSLAKCQHPSVHLARHGHKSCSFNGVELYLHKELNDYWKSAYFLFAVAPRWNILWLPSNVSETRKDGQVYLTLAHPNVQLPNLAERPGPAAILYVRTVNDVHELEPNLNHGVSHLRHPQCTSQATPSWSTDGLHIVTPASSTDLYPTLSATHPHKESDGHLSSQLLLIPANNISWPTFTTKSHDGVTCVSAPKIFGEQINSFLQPSLIALTPLVIFIPACRLRYAVPHDSGIFVEWIQRYKCPIHCVSTILTSSLHAPPTPQTYLPGRLPKSKHHLRSRHLAIPCRRLFRS
jgi:hypothetical protein